MAENGSGHLAAARSSRAYNVGCTMHAGTGRLPFLVRLSGIEMDDQQRQELIRTGWEMHGAVEHAYLSHPATKNVPADWMEKQRLLLADMAIHLLQTALRPDTIELDKLKNNLHAILTISDQFLPHAGLKEATGKLYVED